LFQILCSNPKLVGDPLAYLVDSLIEECRQEHTSLVWENCALRAVGVRALALQYGGVDCISLNEFFCVPENESKYASGIVGKTLHLAQLTKLRFKLHDRKFPETEVADAKSPMVLNKNPPLSAIDGWVYWSDHFLGFQYKQVELITESINVTPSPLVNNVLKGEKVINDLPTDVGFSVFCVWAHLARDLRFQRNILPQ
jgi:hypothetical protein